MVVQVIVGLVVMDFSLYVRHRFVHHFFCRIFDNPSGVFEGDMLQPEVQDMSVFVDGIETADEVRRVIAEIDAPVSINMVEGGQTPMFTFAELQDLGAARVSCPITTILAAMKGVQTALASLRNDARPNARPEALAGFGEIKSRLGADRFDDLGTRFGPKEEPL